MNRLQVFVVLLAVWLAAFGAHACSIFTITRDGQVLFCSNEDFNRRGEIWFVPGDANRYGRVNVGFEKSFAQGSMNEKGLAFDGAALSEVPWEADPDKPTPDNLIEVVMNECATVEEAIRYFEEQNCVHLKNAQLMFADATGDSAVIAWLPGKGLSIERISGGYQVVTNTRLEMSGYRCPRFTRVEQVLRERADASLDTATTALEAVKQYGPGGWTTYTCVYDLKARRLYLYNLSNFDEVLEFSLDEELAKGEALYSMRKIFEESPRLSVLKQGEQRAEYGTRIALSEEALERFAGAYAPETAPEVRIQVAVDGSELLVKNAGQPDAVLFPESATRFRIAPDRGQVSFRLDNDGRVVGMTLHKQIDMHATRIE